MLRRTKAMPEIGLMSSGSRVEGGHLPEWVAAIGLQWLAEGFAGIFCLRDPSAMSMSERSAAPDLLQCHGAVFDQVYGTFASRESTRQPSPGVVDKVVSVEEYGEPSSARTAVDQEYGKLLIGEPNHVRWTPNNRDSRHRRLRGLAQVEGAKLPDVDKTLFTSSGKPLTVL